MSGVEVLPLITFSICSSSISSWSTWNKFYDPPLGSYEESTDVEETIDGPHTNSSGATITINVPSGSKELTNFVQGDEDQPSDNPTWSSDYATLYTTGFTFNYGARSYSLDHGWTGKTLLKYTKNHGIVSWYIYDPVAVSFDPWNFRFRQRQHYPLSMMTVVDKKTPPQPTEPGGIDG